MKNKPIHHTVTSQSRFHDAARRCLAALLTALCLGASNALALGPGLPEHLPADLPADLLLRPWDADFVWVERWGTNGNWNSPGLWRTGTQVGENAQVDFDNTVLINNRNVYRDHLQNIPNGPGAPNAAGVSLWVGTAEPGAQSGNDNINVGSTFTIGHLTVQNVSEGAGRSFRSGGEVRFDSGEVGVPSRITLLGDQDDNRSDDVNIREGTNFELLNDTEMYLLAETGAPRFRIRDNSQITGTGNLYLNPGDPENYVDTGSFASALGFVRRELRIENSGRISTTGEIHVGAARLRLGNDDFGETPDIINTAGIHIHPQGQLRLDVANRTYDFNHAGGAVITINSMGHLMDDNSLGAIRMHAALEGNTGTVLNDIHVLGDSALHAEGEGTLALLGDIYGENMIEKTGEGVLALGGEVTLEADILLSSGTLLLTDTGSLSFFIGNAGVNNRIANAQVDVGLLVLEGLFVFNLSGASDALGDSWTIIDPGFEAVVYGPDFAIANFTEIETGRWAWDSDPRFQYNFGTGQLTVIPEPGTGILLLLGAGALALRNRLRRRC